MNIEELSKLVSFSDGPGVRLDSRNISRGDVFVAIKGADFDGYDFVDQAIENGAEYIVCEREVAKGNVQVVRVEDAAGAGGLLAQAANGWPGKKLVNLAVTGTNGKTTIAFMVQSIIKRSGQKCGLIGTVIYDSVEEIKQAPLTTPDCLTIAECQKAMVGAGAGYMVIEASSHALKQNRLAGVDFKAAAFSNLTGDHLDYHITQANYLASKTKLFEKLCADSTAVLNKDSEFSESIAKSTKANILWFGIENKADLWARIETADINGTVFEINYKGKAHKIRTEFLGLHNVSNLLAAVGLCLSAGLDLETIVDGLGSLEPIAGRLQKVEADKGFSVLVDYAHTDDALKNVLSTLKAICKGRVIVVFGCGGDRDRTKRPRMAKVAEELADVIIVTSDNPRTENPALIIGEIFTGFEYPTDRRIFHDADRKKAIERAIGLAQKDDIVLIAGKGHEDYQILGTEKIHFSDYETAKQILDKL